jgi:hypothetical protein
MYDRSALIAAVRRVEDDQVTTLTTLVARRLGIPRNTAWRLVRGKGAPLAPLAAEVEAAYGVPAAQLVERAA